MTSIVEVKRTAIQEKEDAAAKYKKEMESKDLVAAMKYTETKKLTKQDICIILFVTFGEYLKDISHKNGELDEMLAEYVQKNSGIAIKDLATRTNGNGTTTSEDSGNVAPNDTQTQSV